MLAHYSLHQSYPRGLSSSLLCSWLIFTCVSCPSRPTILGSLSSRLIICEVQDYWDRFTHQNFLVRTPFFLWLVLHLVPCLGLAPPRHWLSPNIPSPLGVPDLALSASLSPFSHFPPQGPTSPPYVLHLSELVTVCLGLSYTGPGEGLHS